MNDTKTKEKIFEYFINNEEKEIKTTDLYKTFNEISIHAIRVQINELRKKGYVKKVNKGVHKFNIKWKDKFQIIYSNDGIKEIKRKYGR